MSEITAITPQVKDKTRCNVYIDGRFYCGLTLETVVKNRLKVGQAVSSHALEEMQLESEKNTAFDKALNHLSATRKRRRKSRRIWKARAICQPSFPTFWKSSRVTIL